jgi:hypothetical protein
MKKIKGTHQSKGKDYKVPRSATFKTKGGKMPKHSTHGGGSKKSK